LASPTPGRIHSTFPTEIKILFKWNNDDDEYPEGLVEEDVVLYPSLEAEIPGLVLE
jgi:hypothetical protein